jgi:hypothetical protein
VLEENASFLHRGTNLANIALKLYKVYLHPYLMKCSEERMGGSADSLIESSGKLIIHDKSLSRLKEDDCR